MLARSSTLPEKRLPCHVRRFDMTCRNQESLPQRRIRQTQTVFCIVSAFWQVAWQHIYHFGHTHARIGLPPAALAVLASYSTPATKPASSHIKLKVLIKVVRVITDACTTSTTILTAITTLSAPLTRRH